MQLVGLAAMSLDGCLTRHDRPGTGFASAEDQAFFRDALQTFDCSIAGPRLQIVLTSTPGLFAEARTDHLEFRNAGVAEVAGELTRRGRTRCALLGGTSLYTEACALGLLDELWVTVEPVAFGEGVRMFKGPVEFRFELVNSMALSRNALVLKYRRLGG